MKIERIDDNTVKCFLSAEELEAYNITYKDFILRSDKAMEVVEEIILQAEEEVGYQPPQYAFDLQIAMLPNQGMILTFSEKNMESVHPARELLECLKEVKSILDHKKTDQAKEGKAKEEPSKAALAVFVFTDLHNICNYAKILPTNIRIQSALYEKDGLYYLFLEKGSASYQRYSRACIQAMEFATLYTAEHNRAEFLKENSNCLIEDRAVKKLQSL